MRIVLWLILGDGDIRQTLIIHHIITQHARSVVAVVLGVIHLLIHCQFDDALRLLWLYTFAQDRIRILRLILRRILISILLVDLWLRL